MSPREKPLSRLAVILQDAYTAGYAAPCFVATSQQSGETIIAAAAAQASPVALSLTAHTPDWAGLAKSLLASAAEADVTLALCLDDLMPPGVLPDFALLDSAEQAGCSLVSLDCRATGRAPEVADRAREDGMLVECLLAPDQAQEAAECMRLTGCDVMGLVPPPACAPPSVHEVVRLTNTVPGMPFCLRLASAEFCEERPETFLPSAEPLLRSLSRTGVCMIRFDLGDELSPQLVETAIRQVGAAGAADYMER